MEVTLIIPQYNRIELTLSCVKSIRAKEFSNWPIIVVDDGSEKERVWIEEQFQPFDVELIFQKHQGVSSAWNRGIEFAKTPYVLLLNNDVMFHGEVIEELFIPLEYKSALMTGVRSRHEKRLPVELLERLPAREFLEGWCFGFRKNLWEKVGRFDELMSVYWSDTDFQLKVMSEISAGQNSFKVCEGLPVCHYGHQTTIQLGDRQKQWREDREVFLNRWNNY